MNWILLRHWDIGLKMENLKTVMQETVEERRKIYQRSATWTKTLKIYGTCRQRQRESILGRGILVGGNVTEEDIQTEWWESDLLWLKPQPWAGPGWKSGRHCECLLVSQEMAPKTKLILDLPLGMNVERNSFPSFQRKKNDSFLAMTAFQFHVSQSVCARTLSDQWVWKAKLCDLHQRADI